MFRWSLLATLCLTVAVLGFSEAAPPLYGPGPAPSVSAESWAKATGHEWIKLFSEPENFYLYKDRLQVGAWDGTYFRTFDPVRKTFGPASLPPWAPEPKVDEGKPKVPNYGVNFDRIKESPEYSVNGKPCTRGEALAAADDIPDESKLFRVVAVGGKGFLDKVSGDWATAKDLHSAAMLQCYEPDFWWAKENGLPDNSLTVCDPTGKAVHFQSGYNLGDWKLFGQAFDPRKVPDLRADPIAALFNKAVEWIKANQLVSLVVAGGLAYWWWNRKQE